MQNELKKELYYDEYIIKHINNPNGRIKFKDIRKITIGISTKDITSCRLKKKQAFYNCFSIIVRLKIDDIFKEFHIKIFNTGKIEVPGVKNDEMFNELLEYVLSILQPLYPESENEKIKFKDTYETVLINSNFNCGFYINREILCEILIHKYHIQSIFDSCSYPGIQCKFYYNNKNGIQTGIQTTDNLKYKKKDKSKDKNIEVSFMIFRTGSVLIVGMCDEYVLHEIYNFVKDVLKKEFKHICQHVTNSTDIIKRKKKRRKYINIMCGVIN
jgi:TATA-box binding protein (TBP) (component of TFIID and TFIIIB)